MSSLYAVEVERVEGSRIELRVRTVHPDAPRPPEDVTFPMNLLADLWDLLRRGHSSLIAGAELSGTAAKTLAETEPWAATLRTLRALSFGVEQPIDAETYAALEAGKSPFGERVVGSWGIVDGERYVHFSGSEDDFADAVEPLVAEYFQDEHVNQEAYDAWPEWPDPATDEALAEYQRQEPSVRLVVTLTDPSLLGFVKSGWSFETAVYF
jgi:hypothetical protein